MRQDKKQTASAFLESIPDIAALIDTDGNVLMINKAGAKSLGRSTHEIIGKNVSELIARNVYEMRRSKWTEVIRTGKMCYLEDKRDGKYFETWFYPIFDTEGKVKSIAIFAHNISNRKRIENEMVMHAAFPEQNPNPVLRISRDGMVVYANRAGEPILRTWGINSGQCVPELWYERVQETLDKGEVSSCELIDSDGRVFLFSLAPVDGKEYLNLYGMDITDHKNLLERNEIILKTCIDGFWLTDTQGQILEVNDAYCRMSGYNRDELLSMSIKDLEASGKPEEISQHIQEIIEKGAHRSESRHKSKDGAIMDLDMSSNYLKFDGGRLFTFFRDITASKQAEKEFRKFKTIADKAGHGIGIADLQNNLVYVNDSYAQMHQYSVSELIGKKISILHTEEQMDYANLLINKIKHKGGFVTEEVWHKKRDNTVFPTLMSATLIKDESGEPLFMAATAIDLTEHKKAEEALQESELRYHTLFEILPVGVGLSTIEGRIIDVNSTFLQMLGYSIEEIKQINVHDTYNNPKERTALVRRLQQDGFVRGSEVQLKRKDGTIFLANLSITTMRTHDKTVLVTVARDISEQKLMEQALAESEEKYRTLVESARDPIATIDKNGTYLFMNKTAAKRLTGREENLAGKTLWDFFPKETADRHAANIRKVIEAEQGVNIVSLTEIQNQKRWYNTTIEPLRDDRGNVIAAIVIARDIDDMKRAQEQVKKLSSVVEQSIDGIAIGALGNELLYVNDSYARMHGYTPKELIGMKVTNLYPPNKAGVYENACHQINIQGALRYETVHVKKDGSTFPAYLSVTILKNDKGEAIGYIAVCRDMTEYKHTLETLRIKDVAIASSINGIAIGDTEGNLTYVNNALLQMWGYDDEEEVLGRNVSEFWLTKEEVLKIIETVIKKGSWIGELKAQRKNGSTFDSQVCVTLVKDENDKPICMMGSCIDISETKRNQEELSRYREQMARAEQLASLGTLSATISHQLTQPLTVIRLSLDNALDELEATSSSGNVIRRLKDSVTQVSNITSIIENFRNFARKSSGKTVTEINLKTVVIRIARLLSESAHSAEISLRIKNMDNLPCPWMNENDIEQLFFALIGNAIQAADGKKSCQLVISGAVKDKYIELRLSDDCGGIAPENIDKIFEPFFTTKPRGQGTGLGLCIVKDIVSRNGGHIRAKSNFGQGTTFIIKIPLEKNKIS